MPQRVLGIGALVFLPLCVVGSLSIGAAFLAKSTVASDEADDPPSPPSRSFFQQHCLDCHAGPTAKAGLDLEVLLADAAVDGFEVDLDDWRLVHERIRRGDMPPPTEPRPSARERARILGWLDEVLSHAPVDPGFVAPRRLNRTEYRNTVRDLLGVDFDPSETFPADDVSGGFDNNANVLSLSPLLLEKYLAAAETIAARAVLDAATDGPPTIVHRVKTLDTDRGRPHGDGISLSTNGQVSFHHEVRQSGRYQLRATVHGQQAGRERTRAAFRVDSKSVEEFEVPETREAPGTYTTELHLEAGARTLAVAFLNDYYNPKHPDRNQRDRNFYVHEMALIGPLDAQPRSAFQRRWIPTDRNRDATLLRDVVERTARRAFRRPVSDSDVDELLEVVLAAAEPGASFETQLRVAITAILVSPRFLFRVEPITDAANEISALDPHALAARLSYFLWSSMPDEPLFAAAADGTLRDEIVWAQHVRRMIRDPRSLALAEHFATQWLQIRDLGQHEPDPNRFPRVDDTLLDAMRQESILFFDAVLRENRSLWTFLDADFTFVNEPLARHYGLPTVRGPWMRRVPVTDESPVLGGILGHASVLTATSNATRTSPVKRGQWILTVLLDAAPPPPPPEVDGLREEEAMRTGATLRELLEQHRADPDCAGCHARMDALGFGLEEYDPVGRRRTHDAGRPVDASGILPDGQSFVGARALREVLRDDTDFLRSIAKQLAVYAWGRQWRPADNAALPGLLRSVTTEPTLERLCLEITRLDAFRARRQPAASASPSPSTPQPPRPSETGTDR